MVSPIHWGAVSHAWWEREVRRVAAGLGIDVVADAFSRAPVVLPTTAASEQAAGSARADELVAAASGSTEVSESASGSAGDVAPDDVDMDGPLDYEEEEEELEEEGLLGAVEQVVEVECPFSGVFSFTYERGLHATQVGGGESVQEIA